MLAGDGRQRGARSRAARGGATLWAVHLVGAVVGSAAARAKRYIWLQRQVSRVAQNEPCSLGSRGRSRRAAPSRPKNLIIASVRARRARTLRVHHPGRIGASSGAAACISASAVRDPVLHRLLVRQHRAVRVAVGSRARTSCRTRARTTPSQRMQWWMGAGTSRCCARMKPSPSAPSSACAGRRTFS